MKNTKKNLYVVFLSVALLIMLAACSDGNINIQNQPQTEHVEADNERLQAENESRQSELNALRAVQIETPSSQVALTQPSLEELLVGEWFNELAKYEFRADGTGVIENLGDLYNFTWNIDDNILTMLTPGAFETSFAFVGDQLHLTDRDSNETHIFTREPSSDFLEINKELLQQESIETSFTRKFVGEWHFDIFIWNFYDDGTGVIDIPEFSGDPANQIKFTFSVTEDPHEIGDVNISIVLPDGRISMYHATFGNQSGGSVTLQPTLEGKEPFMLTRSFDVRNSPITDEIIEEGIALFESFADFMY